MTVGFEEHKTSIIGLFFKYGSIYFLCFLSDNKHDNIMGK